MLRGRYLLEVAVVVPKTSSKLLTHKCIRETTEEATRQKWEIHTHLAEETLPDK
jgi:hypothetical protein